MDMVGSGVFWSAGVGVAYDARMHKLTVSEVLLHVVDLLGASALDFQASHKSTNIQRRESCLYSRTWVPSSTAFRDIHQRLRFQPCRYSLSHQYRCCNISSHPHHLALSETPSNSCTLTLSTDFLFRPESSLTGGDGVV